MRYETHLSLVTYGILDLQSIARKKSPLLKRGQRFRTPYPFVSFGISESIPGVTTVSRTCPLARLLGIFRLS